MKKVEEKALAVLGVPGSVTIKGRTFVIEPRTPRDAARVREQMRQLALPGCTEPLKYVSAQIEDLHPAAAQIATAEALKLGTGGGVEPHEAAIARQYESLDGARFQLWYYARKADKNLTREAVDALVGEDDVYDVVDALVEALKEPGFPKASTSETS